MIGVSYNGVSGSAGSVDELNALMAKGEAGAERTRKALSQTSGASILGRRIGAQAKPSAPKPPEIDPVDGPLVGRNAERSLEPDGMMRARGSRGGWRIPVTRTEMKVEFDEESQRDRITLVKLQYDLVFTEKGLAKERTVEHEVWKQSFFGGGKGEGSGKFSARLISEADASDPVHPIPLAIAFGSDADLDTYNAETKRFACNYDKSGNVKADPPVKVVAVNEYTGGLD